MIWSGCGVLMILVVDSIKVTTTKTAPSKVTLRCIRSRSRSRSLVDFNREIPTNARTPRILDGLFSFGFDTDAIRCREDRRLVPALSVIVGLCVQRWQVCDVNLLTGFSGSTSAHSGGQTDRHSSSVNVTCPWRICTSVSPREPVVDLCEEGLHKLSVAIRQFFHLSLTDQENSTNQTSNKSSKQATTHNHTGSKPRPQETTPE